MTCACGNQCEVIPRRIGEPVDVELRILGYQFSEHIHAREYSKAIRTLSDIEKRSAFLISEIEKESI